MKKKFFRKGDRVVCIKDVYNIKKGMEGMVTKVVLPSIWVDFGEFYGVSEMRPEEIDLIERQNKKYQ